MLSCDKNSHQRFSLEVYFFNCQRSVERRAEQHLSNTELIPQSGKQENGLYNHQEQEETQYTLPTMLYRLSQ